MAYLQDAYKEIYKHPDWKKEAQDHEDYFAQKLYNTDYVQEAARTAVVRFSRIFQAYYGIREHRQNNNGNNIEDQQALVDLAKQVAGDKVNFSSVLEETLLPSGDSSSGAGQIGNARFGVSNTDQEGQKRATDINKKNIEDVINVDGNLREQMTMLYNASFVNGGRNPEQIAAGRSFKNMIVNMTEDDVEQIRQLGVDAKNGELAAFNPRLAAASEQKNYGKKGDIMHPVFQIYDMKSATDKHNPVQNKRKGLLTRFAEGAGRLFYYATHLRKDRGDKLEGLGEKYYNDHEMPLTSREKAYGIDKKTKKLKWKEGFTYFYMKEPVTAEGLLQTAGASGTARRMLSAYKLLGATKNDLLYFRLALIAWMCGSRDHSLYEVLKGSEQVGVKGNEDLSEAVTMYMTVDPLNQEQIREKFAKDKIFPHERIYIKMMKEIAFERKQKYERFKVAEKAEGREYQNFKDDFFELTNLKMKDFKPEEIAINVYTTNAFRNMNFNTRHAYGRKVPFMKTYGLSSKKDQYVAPGPDDKEKVYKAKAGTSYRNSLAHEGKDSDLLKDIEKTLRISARMSVDALQRMVDHPLKKKESEKGLTRTVYRGEYYKSSMHDMGATFVTDVLTSTSKDLQTAHKFLSPEVGGELGDGVISKKKVIGCYKLKGSGIDIHSLSQIEGEDEIIVPPGIQFRVTKGQRPIKITSNDTYEELTAEEIPYLRTLDNEHNPLKHEKLAYLVDLEEVTTDRNKKRDEMQKKYNKRTAAMADLLKRRQNRINGAANEKKPEGAKKAVDHPLLVPVKEVQGYIDTLTKGFSTKIGQSIYSNCEVLIKNNYKKATDNQGADFNKQNAIMFLVLCGCKSEQALPYLKEIAAEDFTNRLAGQTIGTNVTLLFARFKKELGMDEMKKTAADMKKPLESLGLNPQAKSAADNKAEGKPAAAKSVSRPLLVSPAKASEYIEKLAVGLNSKSGKTLLTMSGTWIMNSFKKVMGKAAANNDELARFMVLCACKDKNLLETLEELHKLSLDQSSSRVFASPLLQSFGVKLSRSSKAGDLSDMVEDMNKPLESIGPGESKKEGPKVDKTILNQIKAFNGKLESFKNDNKAMAVEMSGVKDDIKDLDEQFKEAKKAIADEVYAKHKKKLKKIQALADKKNKPLNMNINMKDYQKAYLAGMKLLGKDAFINTPS